MQYLGHSYLLKVKVAIVIRCRTLSRIPSSHFFAKKIVLQYCLRSILRSSVTRLGNLLGFGQVFKAFWNN